MIELRGVTRRFGALTAVDEVSFDVAAGEIVGLLGHNGAGKSTLMRLVNGLLEPDAGHIRVAGHDPATEGTRVRETTGVLGDGHRLDGYLTVSENLEIHAALHGVNRHRATPRIEELLHVLGLWERRHEPVRGLSTGLAQRATLARALVHDPSLLLLDEPTSNLDPVASHEVRELIVASVRDRGRTVLLSTHDLTEAERLCDRIGILRDGKLLAMGPAEELRGRLGGTRGVRITTTPGEVGAIAAALANGTRIVVLGDATAEVVGSASAPSLVAELVAAGVEVHRVEPVSPSLEDLYLSLHAPSAV